MPHSEIIIQLQDNVQIAYRKAIDADKQLDELKKSGLGKFSEIFTKAQGFTARGDRFKPYVEELASELSEIQGGKIELEVALESFIPKLAILLETLAAFKQKVR